MIKNYGSNNGTNNWNEGTEKIFRKEFRLVLESSMKSLSKVEEFLSSLEASSLIDEVQYANILFSITEAITNSISYGNNFNLQKKIYILISYSEEFVAFTIEDEGSGFDFNNIEDPTTAKEQAEKCGRGIFIMKKLSDSLCYSENGKRLNILFHLNK